MTRIMNTLKSILGFVVVILAALVGVLLAGASFFWFLIPKIRKEEREKLADEADHRVEVMRAEIQKAHEARATETAGAIEAVEKQAAVDRSKDSVALANDLLKEDA